MSNDIVRSAQNHLATSSSSGLRKETGKSLVAVGGGGLALSVVAGMLPFVTVSMLLILSVVLGIYWWVK